MINKHFDINFSISEGADEHMFLSVTPGFEHGPGIQRDGITSPRMTDPHTVPAVLNSHKIDSTKLDAHQLPATTNAYVQRSGTWTIYHHIKKFIDTYGDKWQITAVQSNGDLTMNYWHVAYLNREGYPPSLCGLLTNGDPQEDIGLRKYHALIKWNETAAKVRGRTYEFIKIKFEPTINEKWAIKAAMLDTLNELNDVFSELEGYDSNIHDIGPLLEFALAGKPIIKRGVELPFSNAIDKFEDIRHVFNLPKIEAVGHYQGHNVISANFGEYQLYKNINERRAALLNPIIIDLDIKGHVTLTPKNVRNTLISRHYREVKESPTRRGQFREYSDGKFEVFFQHNVYPFGVFGIREAENGVGTELVSLSSGGLSGRVGNTLEGITQIMFDFFSCSDAMVLDEGFDVFALSNPNTDGNLKYSNEQVLKKVCSFSKETFDSDAKEAIAEAEVEALAGKESYPLGKDLKKWPLNLVLAKELENDFDEFGHVPYEDIIMVPPLRSQMRSVLISAIRKVIQPTPKSGADDGKRLASNQKSKESKSKGLDELDSGN